MRSPCLSCSRRYEDKKICGGDCEKLQIFQAQLRGRIASDDVYERLQHFPRPEIPSLLLKSAI